jgi:ribonuclease HI
MTKHIIIHTDGACKGNPGIGSWAATLEYKGIIKEICGVSPNTTNNQMELMAVIEALKALKQSCTIDIYTDSQYVQNGMNKWIEQWKQKNWKNIKNVELWQELDKLAKTHTIKWHWVRGHSGHTGNERVDLLANLAIKDYLSTMQ